MQRSDGPAYPDAKQSSSYEDGVEYQDFVVEALARRGIVVQLFTSRRYQFERGESLNGFEIKLDRRCLETGQLSIEIGEKSRANVASWTPSGILRNDNAVFYVQGNRQIVFVFAKQFLRNYFWSKKPTVHESYGTVQKFYLRLDIAKKHAALWLDLTEAA